MLRNILHSSTDECRKRAVYILYLTCTSIHERRMSNLSGARSNVQLPDHSRDTIALSFNFRYNCIRVAHRPKVNVNSKL